MLRSVLIDDEKHSLVSLEMELQKYCPQVEVVATCKGAKAGVEGILEHTPDLVFLDIDMPGKNGFQLLEEVRHIPFDVIFTTAYDEYAIRAFKVSAMDYLLKPIDPAELRNAVDKVVEKRENTDSHKKLDVLLTNFQYGREGFQKLAVPTMNGLDFIDVSEIAYCKADGSYTSIVTTGKSEFVLSKTIKETEELLKNPLFFRTHQSYLVNLNFISKYVKGSGGQLILHSGTVIPVARARKEALMQLIYKK